MSLPNGPTPDDPTLVRYLIGSLPEEEAERLDELSVVDREFAERLNAAEYDLVDAYVNGELSGETLDRFTSHYLSLPANILKVNIARGLQRDRGLAPLTAPSRAERAMPRLRPQWWIAAAAALVLAVGGYLVADNLRLRRQVVDALERRTALEQRQRQLQQALDDQRSAAAAAAEELSRARTALERAARDQPAGKGGVLGFTLLPSMRDAGAIPTIALRSGTDTVTLRLQLEDNDFTRYRATLTDVANDRIVWRSGVLRAVSTGDIRSVSVAVAARLLEARTYTVALSGVPVRGAPDVLGNYTFRVVLQ